MLPSIKSKKTQHRVNLYSRVESLSVEMAPCSRYEQRGFTCLVVKDSSRYSRYIQAGGSVQCHVHGPSEESWRSLERAEKKLDDEWTATQERLLAL